MDINNDRAILMDRLKEIRDLVDGILSRLSARAERNYPVPTGPEILRMTTVIIDLGKKINRQIEDTRAE